MSYGRYILIAALAFYLILVWMYFKDNTLQLTSKGLLLWFIVVPLAIISVIIMLMWQQKKIERKATTPTDVKEKKQAIKSPNIHKLFITTSICLPEGDSWADIIANEEDLNILSTDLLDYDGLPILTKPIAYIADDPDLYNEMEDKVADLDDSTQRIGAMIQQLLLSSEDTLAILAEHFEMLSYDKTNEPNSAIHIHPEWQQHYIASATDNSSENTSPTLASQTKLSFFICLPSLAETAIIIDTIKQQLLSYGLLEHHYTITTIYSEADEGAELQPEQFINDQLIKLTNTTKPEVCVLIVADSHLNESWVESSTYLDSKVNTIPTEASTLLLFSNKAAQDQLNMTVTSLSFTDISELLANNAANNLNNENASNSSQYHHFYTKNLNNIEQLLLRSGFNLSALTEDSETSSQHSDKTGDSEQEIATDPLLDYKITVLSDINSSTQPYDLSEFMSFTDSFIKKGALVNEHHLGHYMPLNVWLKSFIALALLVDLAPQNQQSLEYQLLITQYKHHCILWLADHAEDK